MATDPGFVAYVAEQINLGSRLTHRKMFGEYALYVDGKVVAFLCDNSLFIKPSQAAVRLAPDLPQRPPYPGAKDYPVADELLDETEAIRALILATAVLMPEPKLRKTAGTKAVRDRKDVRLFTLPGGRRRNPAVQKFLAALPDEIGDIARKWFKVMSEAGPDVVVLLHDGQPTACVENLAFGHVAPYSKHVNVGFFMGAALKDPDDLLEGAGRYMRHVKVRPGVFNQDAALLKLIKHAYADIKGRLPL